MKKITFLLLALIFSTSLFSFTKEKKDLVKEVIFNSYNGNSNYHINFYYDELNKLKKTQILYRVKNDSYKEIYEKNGEDIQFSHYKNGKIDKNVLVKFTLDNDLVKTVNYINLNENFEEKVNFDYENGKIIHVNHKNNLFSDVTDIYLKWNGDVIDTDSSHIDDGMFEIVGEIKYIYLNDESYYNNTNINLNYLIGVGYTHEMLNNYIYSTEWFGKHSNKLPYTNTKIENNRSFNKVIKYNGKIVKIIVIRKDIVHKCPYGEYLFIY